MGMGKDGKLMWNNIEWNGKVEIKIDKTHHDYQIYQYFKNIFCSHKMNNLPTVSNIIGDFDNYHVYTPMLDDPPDSHKQDTL